MEKYTLTGDIHVLCVTASSFPAGIMAAHKQLHAMIPFSKDRRYFGLSRPEGGGSIIYKAAAEELSSAEAVEGIERFTIAQGEYISIIITDYMKDLQGIGNAFQQLLAYPGIDLANGYCLEWYLSDKDVRCMVPLAQ